MKNCSKVGAALRDESEPFERRYMVESLKFQKKREIQ